MTDNFHINFEKNAHPREVRNQMSVFTYPWRWASFRGFFKNIAQFFHNIGDMLYRAKYGFCKHDVWNCDSSIVDYLINILTEFRNTTIGYPTSFATYNKWIAFLDEIIDRLEFSRTDSDRINPYYNEELGRIIIKGLDERTDEEVEVLKLYYNEEVNIENEKKEALIEAFTMLAPYMGSLWW